MNVTTNIPVTVQIRRTRLLALIVSVAAVAAAGTWAITSTGGGNHSAQTSVPTSASVLASLTPSERQHVLAITSMTPAQLKAGFGTGNVDAIDALRLTPNEEKYLRAITTMTPAQLKAAFGTPTLDRSSAVLASLTPSERQHVQAITSMTQAQLKAAFGTTGQ